MSSIPEDDEIEVIDIDKIEEDDEYFGITPSEAAQAFSHFSFHHSGEKRILVDWRE